MGPAGLGWAADTGPAWPGLLFAFLGPRDSVRFPGRGGGGLVRAGPGGAAGRLPRRSARRTVCSRDSEPRELRLRVSPREVFTLGGLWLVSSLSATQGGRENSKPVPPTLSSFPKYTLGVARWELRPQLVPFCPAPSAAVFKISQFLLGLGSSGFPYSIRKLV